jgi:hypothetical protein
MPRDKKTDTPVPRRIFLAALTTGLAASAAALRGVSSQNELRIFKTGDLERLRLEFNSDREKVRLLAVLSPT